MHRVGIIANRENTFHRETRNRVPRHATIGLTFVQRRWRRFYPAIFVPGEAVRFTVERGASVLNCRIKGFQTNLSIVPTMGRNTRI